jgi:hypothetical protein
MSIPERYQFNGLAQASATAPSLAEVSLTPRLQPGVVTLRLKFIRFNGFFPNEKAVETASESACVSGTGLKPRC